MVVQLFDTSLPCGSDPAYAFISDFSAKETAVNNFLCSFYTSYIKRNRLPFHNRPLDHFHSPFARKQANLSQ